MRSLLFRNQTPNQQIIARLSASSDIRMLCDRTDRETSPWMGSGRMPYAPTFQQRNTRISYHTHACSSPLPNLRFSPRHSISDLIRCCFFLLRRPQTKATHHPSDATAKVLCNRHNGCFCPFRQRLALKIRRKPSRPRTVRGVVFARK